MVNDERGSRWERDELDDIGTEEASREGIAVDGRKVVVEDE